MKAFPGDDEFYCMDCMNEIPKAPRQELIEHLRKSIVNAILEYHR
jgi:hypothetical protein